MPKDIYKSINWLLKQKIKSKDKEDCKWCNAPLEWSLYENINTQYSDWKNKSDFIIA